LGYKKALEDHYIDLDKNLIYEVGISNKELQEPARRLFDEQEDVTAIFGPNDRIAAAALHVAEQRGIQVPEDVSIVGYGNLNLDTSIPLTTVKQPAYKMGETAADLLLERIKKGDIPRQKVVLPVKLLKKGSTGPCLSQEQFSEKEEKESMVEAKIQA
jgi:LacI family transcriptional regulator